MLHSLIVGNASSSRRSGLCCGAAVPPTDFRPFYFAIDEPRFLPMGLNVMKAVIIQDSVLRTHPLSSQLENSFLVAPVKISINELSFVIYLEAVDRP